MQSQMKYSKRCAATRKLRRLYVQRISIDKKKRAVDYANDMVRYGLCNAMIIEYCFPKLRMQLFADLFEKGSAAMIS